MKKFFTVPSKKLYNDLTYEYANKHKIDLKKYDYSKTLEKMLLEEKFDLKYLDKYLEIEYNENLLFTSTLNTFLEKEYTTEELNGIYQLSLHNINKLKKLEKTNVLPYIEYANLNVNNITRYENYNKKNDLDLQDVVTRVNLNLDKKFYEIISPADELHKLHIMVNKTKYLSSDYVPNDLTKVLGVEMVKEAADQLIKFLEFAQKQGYYFKPSSAYRGFAWQNQLYTTYKNKEGQEKADTYSAKPGHSEHQTGLAVDLGNKLWWENGRKGIRINQTEFIWLKNNCHKYGFIIRFPENSSHITGYMTEEWHLRYLGIELATKISESKLTFDEYYDLFIEKY